MSLFKRSEKESSPSCSCGCCHVPAGGEAQAANAPKLAVLGAGCSRCKELLSAAREASVAVGIGSEPEYITDMKTIMSFGVMSLPALVVSGRVVSAGRVLKSGEVEKLLRENLR